MKLAVLTYANYGNNIENIPGEWPAEVKEVADDYQVISPWVEMTLEQYNDYLEQHRAAYEAWQYQHDLADLKSEIIEKLWKSAYDYNFQFFSGGIYAQIVELKLAGSQRALESGNWILALWEDYYVRKFTILAATTFEIVRGISLDFSNNGAPPWTVPEMLEEVQRSESSTSNSATSQSSQSS